METNNDKAAPTVDAAELGKLVALAEAAKRYDHAPGAMVQDASGYWMKYSDHAALVAQQAARIAELTTERDQFKAQADAMTDQIAIMESNLEGK